MESKGIGIRPGYIATAPAGFPAQMAEIAGVEYAAVKKKGLGSTPAGWAVYDRRSTRTIGELRYDTEEQAWAAAWSYAEQVLARAEDTARAEEQEQAAAAARPAGWVAPTDRQLAYAARLGITVTPSMSRRDVSAAIDDATGRSSDGYSDYVTRRTRDRYGIRGQIWDEE